MSDTQLYLSIRIPTITIILAWLSNKADNAALRAEMNALWAEMNALWAEMNAL